MSIGNRFVQALTLTPITEEMKERVTWFYSYIIPTISFTDTDIAIHRFRMNIIKGQKIYEEKNNHFLKYGRVHLIAEKNSAVACSKESVQIWKLDKQPNLCACGHTLFFPTYQRRNFFFTDSQQTRQRTSIHFRVEKWFTIAQKFPVFS